MGISFLDLVKEKLISSLKMKNIENHYILNENFPIVFDNNNKLF